MGEGRAVVIAGPEAIAAFPRENTRIGARFRKISPVGLFYFGCVLKADDLDGSLSLVDAIVKQVISVD